MTINVCQTSYQYNHLKGKIKQRYEDLTWTDMIDPGQVRNALDIDRQNICSTNAFSLKPNDQGTSLVVQWLRLYTPTAGGTGSIPSQRTKILHIARQKKRKRNIIT